MGNLVFPNYGLNALQVFDSTTRKVVQTIPVPPPYSIQGSIMLLTVLVRGSDHRIFVNVRDGSGNPAVLVLTEQGRFVAVQDASLSAGWFLQQIAFDPLDGTESTVIGGVPFVPEIRAINPFTHSVTTRVSTTSANFIGIATDSLGNIYAGDYNSGRIFVYSSTGVGTGVYVDVWGTTGSNEINAMTRDAAGNMYVAQNSSNRIVEYDSANDLVAVFRNASFNHPSTVFFNPNDGLLYVGNIGDGNVTILTTSGSEVAVVSLGGWGVGVGGLVPSPKLQIANLQNTVRALLSAGILNRSLGQYLLAPLDAALAALYRLHTAVAVRDVNGFITRVRLLVYFGLLKRAEGRILIDLANGIVEALRV